MANTRRHDAATNRSVEPAHRSWDSGAGGGPDLFGGGAGRRHAEIAALSTRGERRTIAAGHAIQWEKPEAVIADIEEALALARGG